MSIKAIDKASIHHITSGQVVIDLQTAVKELVENSVDAGATSIEVRFRNHGLSSIEVIDNGCGIAEADHESIALKHHTSKLETFSDLTSVETFGFRGEALSSLCALSGQVSITTATATTAPMGITLIMDSSGKITTRSTVARNQGTTITLTNIFSPLAVRRKELERNIKREYAKALSLLNAYALGPCAAAPGARLTVSNQQEKGAKSVQIRTLGSPSCRASVTALWGPKSLDNIVDMDLNFEVEREKIALKRLQTEELEPFSVQVKGLISKFSVGCGRAGTDRQFFYVNGRPCNMNKVQKSFNEVYRSFNATQAPFIVADFILPTQLYDVNVSPDKRTILLHSEANLILALKATLEEHFAPSRATFDLGDTQTRSKPLTQSLIQMASSSKPTRKSASQDEDTSDASQLPTIPSPRPSPVPSASKVHHPLPASDGQELPVDLTMNIDSEPEAPTVVLNTSQTSWGNRLGLPSQRAPSLSPPSAEGDGGEEIDVIPTEDQHPRKKRKSDIGAIPVHTSYAGGQERVPPGPSSSSATASGTGAHKPVRVDQVVTDVDHSVPATPPIQVRSRGSKDLHAKIARVPKRAASLQSRLSQISHSGSRIPSRRRNVSVGRLNEDGEGQCSAEEEEEDELDDEGILPSPPGINEHTHSNSKSADLSVETDGDEQQGEGSPLPTGADEADDIRSSPRTCDASDIGCSTITAQEDDPRIEILKMEQNYGDISLRFDAIRAKRIWSQRSTLCKPTHPQIDGEETPSIPADAGVNNTDDGDGAASALARVIEKKDFGEMDIVGQFNLGFIVVRRQHKQVPEDGSPTTKGLANLDDLFIVDQHAADEKYNFETLQATTKIESQKLFRPRPLELTASDEMVAIENMNILQQNGFEIDISQETSISEGSRLKLTAQPVSKSTTFDMKDLEEVIHLLRDRPGAQMVRCSKARAMFAMRACRKSVMVGMSLTSSQMTTVVRHMGTMDQPWNCPHGRPTMRHLIDIRSCGSEAKQNIDWSSFQ